MSTSLKQSQWLGAVAWKIEQECPRCAGKGYRVVDVPFEAGRNLEDCNTCSGSGKVCPYAEGELLDKVLTEEKP